MIGALTLGHFLTLGAMLFALSVIGIFLNRKNLIVLLMAIELMLLAVGDKYEPQIAAQKEADAKYR